MASAKPTPGPYRVNEFACGVHVRANDEGTDVPIASFWDSDALRRPSRERARANARAWVEGRDAMDRLARIRAIMKSTTWVEEKLSKVHSILDEVKP
jgi:hypothetical protein